MTLLPLASAGSALTDTMSPAGFCRPLNSHAHCLPLDSAVTCSLMPMRPSNLVTLLNSQAHCPITSGVTALIHIYSPLICPLKGISHILNAFLGSILQCHFLAGLCRQPHSHANCHPWSLQAPALTIPPLLIGYLQGFALIASLLLEASELTRSLPSTVLCRQLHSPTHCPSLSSAGVFTHIPWSIWPPCPLH